VRLLITIMCNCGKKSCTSCCPKTIRGAQGPKGDRGVAGPTGPIGPAGDSAQNWITIPIHGDTYTYKIESSITFVGVARFTWPGTALGTGTFASMLANIWGPSGVGSFDVRVYDVTNSQTIAAATGITSALDTNIDNLLVAVPSPGIPPAVLEIQVRGENRGAAVEVAISSLTITFN